MADDPEVEAISLVEEELHLKKRDVSTGRVRVSTVVDNVDEMVRATLEESRVEVTRVPVDRMVDKPPETRTENGVLIVPVFEEVLVVEKRLLVKEELHIRRIATSENVEVPVTLRKQRAVVERVEGEDTLPRHQEADL